MSQDPSRSRKTIVDFVRPYSMSFALVVVTVFIVAVLELLPPLLTRHLIDAGIVAGDLRTVYLMVALTVVTGVVTSAVDFLSGYVNANASECVLRDLRRAIVSHLTGVPIAVFARTRRGVITNRIAGDVELVRHTLSRALPGLALTIFDVILVSITLAIVSWRLALVTVACIALFAVPFLFIVKALNAASNAVNARRDDLTSLVQRVYSQGGMSLLRAFGAGQAERAAVRMITDVMFDVRLAFGKQSRLLQFLGALLVTFAPAAIGLVGGIEYFAGRATLGTIIAATAFVMRMFTSISLMSVLVSQAVGAANAFERIRSTLLLDREQEGGLDAAAVWHVDPSVQVDRLSLDYGGGRGEVLTGITLKWQSPQFLAIVGPSGGGKTTVLNALIRFYEASRGTIDIGAKPIAELSVVSTRRLIATAQQDCFIQNMSIAEVIRYGNEHANDAEVAEALRISLCDVFLRQLPLGVDTIVGDRGQNLSGGQRQRVALARAILKNAPILVLDEATSALDFESECSVLENVRRAYRDRLVIVISHRLSSVATADKIFVVADGAVREQGTHAELLVADGLYSKLWLTHAKSLWESVEKEAAL